MARKGSPPSVPEAEPPGLSEQQRRIYGLARQGKTVQQITLEMGASEVTVRTQLGRIRDKDSKGVWLRRQGVKSMLFWQALNPEDLDFLTRGQRQVVTLRRAGRSSTEIARVLGLTKAAVRTRLRDAKARLAAWPRAVSDGTEGELPKEE